MTGVLVLDASDTWVRLPFEALGRLVPTSGVIPTVHRWRWAFPGPAPAGTGWREVTVHVTPRALGRLSPALAGLNASLLRRACPDATVVCATRPDQRAWLGRFPGCRRFYYAADDFSTSYGWPAARVHEWEREMLARADGVIAVSEALAERFTERYRWPRARVHVSPNAFPRRFLPAAPPDRPAPLPGAAAAAPRPVLGVLGTISSRIRLDWMRAIADALPWLHVLFVGPVRDLDTGQRDDLRRLESAANCSFTGAVGYEDLFGYAAGVDAAFLPLGDGGINPAASPVRFFTHLPFGQPILATPGCRQVREFAPLATVCDSPGQAVEALRDLRARGFDDGLRGARWEAAGAHTWEARAEELRRVLLGP